MASPKQLYRTRITIWTDYDPTEAGVGLEYLGREAEQGSGFCSEQATELVTNPDKFPATEFFDDGEGED